MNDEDPNNFVPPVTPDSQTTVQPDTEYDEDQQYKKYGIANSTSTAVEDIDPEFENIAMEKIKEVFKGNGIKLDNIKCEHFEGVTLSFLATTKLQFRLKVLEQTVAGRKEGSKQISSPSQIHEEKAKQEQKITHRADVIKRIQTHIVEERKDMGYGVDGQMIKLPFLYTDYVMYEGCQNCKTKGTVMCQRCNGLGMEMCTRCEGQGLELCTQCSGSQYVQGPNGQRQQCNRCMGRGKTSCTLCHEKRKIQCRICRTKGTTQCTVCNGHKWNTHIYRLEIDAMPSFDYDRQNVEDRVGTIVEEMGSDLIHHAHIHPIFKERDEKQSEDKRDYITIPYVVKLPYGDVKFSIGDGETYNTMIFGNNCELRSMPFLLDRLLKKPLSRLKEAAEERGNVAEKIKNAGRYKTIRQAILGAAKMPNHKAIKKIQALNPHGIQDKTIAAMVENADKALKNITRKPRQQGFYLGIALCFAFFGAYFAGGARNMIVAHIPNKFAEIAIDVGLFGIGFYLALTLIKFMGRNAIAEALGGLVPPGKEKSYKPKVGKKVTDRLLIAIPVIFLIMIEASVHVPVGATPWWYTEFRNLLGL